MREPEFDETADAVDLNALSSTAAESDPDWSTHACDARLPAALKNADWTTNITHADGTVESAAHDVRSVCRLFDLVAIRTVHEVWTTSFELTQSNCSAHGARSE